MAMDIRLKDATQHLQQDQGLGGGGEMSRRAPVW